MIEQTKIELQHIGELYSKKGDTTSPHTFNLGHLSHSGVHIAEVTEETL